MFWKKKNASQKVLDYVILDTETTGLDENSEIIEIAVIDLNGNVLFNSLVCPSVPMPNNSYAIEVHGITNEMLASAPKWPEIYHKIKQIISDKQVIIYNAQFDVRLLNQTNIIYGLEQILFQPICAMLAFASWYGEINENTGEFRWQRLNRAMRLIEQDFDGAHRALVDCKATLSIWQAIQGKTYHEYKVITHQTKNSEFQEVLKRALAPNSVVLSVNREGKIGSKSILHISVTGRDGTNLLDQYVQPLKKIRKNVKYLCNLEMTPDDFLKFPMWPEVYETLKANLSGKTVLISGIKCLNQENQKYNLPKFDFDIYDLDEISTRWYNAPWHVTWDCVVDIFEGTDSKTFNVLEKMQQIGIQKDYFFK